MAPRFPEAGGIAALVAQLALLKNAPKLAVVETLAYAVVEALVYLARDNSDNQAAICEAGAVDPLHALVRAGGSDGSLGEAAEAALEELDLAVISSPVETPQAEKASRKRRLEAPECVVCFERARAVAFVPCGHFCVCSKCGHRLDECPICRKSTRKQRIYT